MTTHSWYRRLVVRLQSVRDFLERRRYRSVNLDTAVSEPLDEEDDTVRESEDGDGDYLRFIPIFNVKAIRAASMETQVKCGKCQGVHKKKYCVRINCGHEFGTGCLRHIVKDALNSRCAGGVARCPLCLEHITKMTAYRAWNKPTPKDEETTMLLPVPLNPLRSI